MIVIQKIKWCYDDTNKTCSKLETPDCANTTHKLLVNWCYDGVSNTCSTGKTECTSGNLYNSSNEKIKHYGNPICSNK